jgi:hypothetical protein
MVEYEIIKCSLAIHNVPVCCPNARVILVNEKKT